MEYNNLLELMKTVSELNISGFQYEEGDMKIIITTGGNGLPGCMSAGNGAPMGNMPVAASTQKSCVAVSNPGVVQEGVAAQSSASVLNAGTTQAAGNIVKSPLVGTFYAAPSEEAEPFVQVGDVVKKGQTLAIVEAMKLMNDIESEYDGKILEIFVENGDAVEYGQPLFSIG